MSNRLAVIIVLVAGLLFVGSNSIYILNEMERGVLLRVGAVVNSDISTGIHVKLPFIEEVRSFDGRVLTVDAPAERFLTLEKKALIVDSFAKFKIKKVEKYYTASIAFNLPPTYFLVISPGLIFFGHSRGHSNFNRVRSSTI